MKAMPASARTRVTWSASSITLTPISVSASAAPDLDERLRLPCLATVTPAPATTNAVAVEMLSVPLPSPPVPTISIAPLGPIWEGVALPSMIRLKASSASARVSARSAAVEIRGLSWSDIFWVHSPQEILYHRVAMFGRDAFGVKLNAVDGQAFMGKTHDGAIFCGGGDVQAIGQAFALDHKGVVARGLKGGRKAGKDAGVLMLNGAHFAMHDFLGLNDFAAKGLTNGLVPKANPHER